MKLFCPGRGTYLERGIPAGDLGPWLNRNPEKTGFDIFNGG